LKDFILKKALEWAASYLTAEKVAEWENQFVGATLPKLYAWKDELILGLRDKAADSETKIDDKAVDAADAFLTKFLDRLKD